MANAARHFPLKATQKAIDVSAFVMAAFIIESPRIIRSAQLARQPRTPPRGPAQVFYPFAATGPAPQAAPPSPPGTPPAAAATSSGPPPVDGGGPLPPIAEGPPDPSAFGGEGA